VLSTNFFNPACTAGLKSRSQKISISRRRSSWGIGLTNRLAVAAVVRSNFPTCVAVARAVHFGARVLILDEPTSALGVKQAEIVLDYVRSAKARGIGVVLITHNVQHAYPIGDTFVVLFLGRQLGVFKKTDLSETKLMRLMAGKVDAVAEA